MDKKLKALLLFAALGLLASLVAPSGGFEFRDQTLEADNGSLVISADEITVSVRIVPDVVDNRVIQEISEMRAKNLRIVKVDARGVLEIRAAEARGSGIVQVIDVDGLENFGLGYLFKLLVKNNETLEMKNSVIKDLELPVMHMFNQSVTLYGLEVSLKPCDEVRS